MKAYQIQNDIVAAHNEPQAIGTWADRFGIDPKLSGPCVEVDPLQVEMSHEGRGGRYEPGTLAEIMPEADGDPELLVEGEIRGEIPPAPPPTFRVSVNRMVESHRTTYWVCLDRPDRPIDAKPWDAGRMTPYCTEFLDRANLEGQEWAKFFGCAFKPYTEAPVP